MFVVGVVLLIIAAAFLLRQAEYKENSRNLEEHLPIWKVEDDLIISKYGDITIAYEVALPEIFSLSNDEYEAVHELWVKAIKVLPNNTIVHKQDWFLKDRFDGNIERDDNSFLGGASDRFFHERPFLNHRCYMFVTRRPAGRKVSSSAHSNLLRKKLVPEDAGSAAAIVGLQESTGQFERILKDSGLVELRRMSGDEITGTPERAGIIEQYCYLLDDAAKPVVKDIEFKPSFKIGSSHLQLFSLADVTDMPALCGPRINYDRYSTDKTKFSIGFVTPVCQLLNCNHIYNQFIFIGDGQLTIKKLESKRLRLQSLSAYSRQNAISREAVNAFLNEAISQQRSPVRAHFNVLAWTDNPSEAKELRNMTSSALAQMESTPREEIKGAPQIFWAGIPGNAGDFPSNETFDTFLEQATCFFNSESNSKDSLSPFGLRVVDRLNGRPLWVDISDLPMRNQMVTNRNKAVFGASGSGKSMWMCHFHRCYYEQGAHVLIVDVGHSYESLCKLLNGYYFTYTEKSPMQFNPFYIADGDVLDTEKKESLKTLLVALWKRDDEAFRRSEYVALSNAIHLYYEKLASNQDIFPCFNTFFDYLQEEYVHVLASDQVKEKDFDVSNFLYVLRPYYKTGEFGYLLNATEKLDVFHQRFVVFELDAVKDHPTLFPVITLVIMELFISKMRKLKGIRKVITIEEAWKAISRSGMAEFMKYLYKTVRKHFGEAIVVSQELDDVISSPIVKDAILNNADCKILLDMRKFQNKFDQIQTVMGMSNKGKVMTLSLNKSNYINRRYREVYIELGGTMMRVYGFEPSPEEYYAYSTEEKDKVLVKQYAEKFGGDIRKGIRALLADLKENGKLN